MVWTNMMKGGAALLLAVFAGCTSATQPAPSPSPPEKISTHALESGSAIVVGALGRPLGTVVEIEATVVAVPSRPVMGFGFGQEYGLRVDAIDGQPVSAPPVVRFEVERTFVVKVAPSEAAWEDFLRQLSLRDQFYEVTSPGAASLAEPLTAAQIAALREHYVGSKHKLLAYETGGFVGTPASIPEDKGMGFLPIPKFGFSSYVLVFWEK